MLTVARILLLQGLVVALFPRALEARLAGTGEVDVHAGEELLAVHPCVDPRHAEPPRREIDGAPRRAGIQAGEENVATQPSERNVLHGVGDRRDVQRGVDAAEPARLDHGLALADVAPGDVLRGEVLLLVPIAVDHRDTPDAPHAREVGEQVGADVAGADDGDRAGDDGAHRSSGVQRKPASRGVG